MIEFINECVGCPPEIGCMGDSCPNRHVPVLVCDECKNEPDELYLYDVDGKQLCEECLKEHFEKITYDNWYDYSTKE